MSTLFRPSSLEPMTPGQWQLFYRLAKPGHSQATHHHGLPTVPLVTPADLPPLSHHASSMPPVVTVVRADTGEQRTYRLMKTPRILDWTPDSAYANLYLFTVR